MPSRSRPPIALAVLGVIASGISLTACSSCHCGVARSRPWRYQESPEELASRLTTVTAEQDTPDAGDPATDGQPVDSIRIWLSQKSGHLHPLKRPSVTSQRILLDTVFETLVRRETSPGALGPATYLDADGRSRGLAKTWKVTDDGLSIELILQDKIRFHDGRRLSSVDVQYSLDSARGGRMGELVAEHLKSIATVEIVTRHKVRLTLYRRDGYVLRGLAMTPIVPAHIYSKRVAAKSGGAGKKLDPKVPIGTGPYRIDPVSEPWTNNSVLLTRFGDYWGRAPAVESIEFVYQPDAGRAFAAARQGRIDILPEVAATHQRQLATAPMAEVFKPVDLPPAAFSYLALNTARAPFSDKRIREVVTRIVDREQIVRVVYSDQAVPIATPVWVGGPGDGAAKGAPTRDIRYATEVLEADGWRREGAHRRWKKRGKLLRVVFLASDASSPERDVVVKNLRDFGFQVIVKRGPPGFLAAKPLPKGDFDLVLLSWRGWVDQQLTSLVGKSGRKNYGKYASKRVTSVLSDLRGAASPSARAPLMTRLSELLATDWPVIGIVRPQVTAAFSRRISGFQIRDDWFSIRDLQLE